MTVADVRRDAALVVTGPPRWEPGGDGPPDPDATLLLIDPQGEVTAFSGKVEYGQGIRSGFALAIADELDVPPASVRVILGDTSMVPRDRGTAGSASTRTVGFQLRRAAAAARRALIALAAEGWDVPAESLATSESHVFRVAEPGQTISYADLLENQDLTVPIAEDTLTKDPEGFLVMGHDVQRTDALARVTGQARYSQDVVVPGMLYGRVLRPPSYGARLQQIDSTRAERVPGVVMLVREGDFVGAVGDREDTAEYALAAIRARWEEIRDLPSDWDLPVLLKDKATEPVVVREDGSLAAGFDQADHVFESAYFIPFVANAALEPSAAVASWDGDNLTVWCGDRSPLACGTSWLRLLA